MSHKWLPSDDASGRVAEQLSQQAALLGASLSETKQAVRLAMADFIHQTVADRVPRRPPLGEFVFAQDSPDSHGLRPLLAERWADVSQNSVQELRLKPEWLSAATAATLAMLHVEQIPLGGTLQTGAAAARVAGRLTPGTPQNWRRLLKQMADNQPATMSLRSAM
jgi:hypothetical protein